jgi:hypothetical protein
VFGELLSVSAYVFRSFQAAKQLQAATVVASMRNMLTTDLKKFSAHDIDNDDLSQAHRSGTKHLVNLLSYNGSDREVDYGEIFGDDLETLIGLRIWVCENWKVKAVDEDVCIGLPLTLEPGSLTVTKSEILFFLLLQDYGKFHSQDCYIILHATENQYAKVPPRLLP